MTHLKAILGPTNTGKTHYAIERMMGHATGMIGLPLRLLAREVYDRVVAAKGVKSVALITGEERIEPPTARYWICTVESMPVHRRVAFVAIDEVQLAENRERGHVFTDRLLNLRGTQETLLLGSDTMRGVLRDLDLDAETDTRERFSELKYAGPIKITKLPKRSAVVAFSADEVYAIGELLRRQKGGAAIVMGALSPRTRNAQVELYQAGEVDYLVATDAVGMGLNLDVEHVAFAARQKFDGQRRRFLTAAECGQIAGRAGRFRSDGTFGETSDCAPFDEEMVRRIENHNFESVDQLSWRNSDLDFRSIKTLIASLGRASGNPMLRQNPDALDEWVLRRMAEDSNIGPDVRGERNVRRLWDLARLPDFRKAGYDGHGRLVLGLADTLADPKARLGDAGMEKRMISLSSTLGDIAQLQQRLAAIRTWTYAAHRDDWLANPALWRDKTREIEDKLSDALHEALTARFVDRRTSVLMSKLNAKEALVSEMDASGEVTVEGHVVGRLVGLTFEPDSNAKTLEGKAVRSAALEAVRPILEKKLAVIATSDDTPFAFTDAGGITFKAELIARLTKGTDWLAPGIELIGAAEVDANSKLAVQNRLAEWLKATFVRVLPTLNGLKHLDTGKDLEGIARGMAFRLMESGAAIDLRDDDPAHRITPEQREALKAIGVRPGRVSAHATDAQKPAAQKLISTLRTVYDDDVCPVAPEGAGSFALDGTWPDAALLANGYLRFGKRAVRADLAERLAWEVSKKRRESEKSAFAIPAEMASIVSCPADDFISVLKGLGISPAEKDPETGVPTLWRYATKRRPDAGGAPRPPRRDKAAAGGGGKGGAPRGDRGRNKGGNRPDRSGPSPHKRREFAAERRAADPDNPFAALKALLPDPPAPKKPKKRKGKKAKPQGQPAVATPVADKADAPSFDYKPFG